MKKTSHLSCLIALSVSLALVACVAIAQAANAKPGKSNAPSAELNPYMGAPEYKKGTVLF